MTLGLPGPPNQDYIVLGGFPSPGLAVVKNAGTPRKWDVREPTYMSGGTCIFIGEALATFDVDIFCWETAHFVAWQFFAKMTLAPPGGQFGLPISRSIQHPALNDYPLTISQVSVTNVSQWEQDPDGGGLWCRTISFLQYRAPKPAAAKVFEGPPGSPVVVPPPIDPQLMIIETQSTQITKLAGP